LTAKFDYCSNSEKQNECISSYLGTMITLSILYLPIDVYLLYIVKENFGKKYPPLENKSEEKSTTGIVLQLRDAESSEFDQI